MKKKKLFPKISAQVFNSPHNIEEFFLFNTSTNKGFAIDGMPAILCKKFTGESSLESIIEEFESEQEIEHGDYDTDIEDLLVELEKHNLIAFHDKAQPPK